MPGHKAKRLGLARPGNGLYQPFASGNAAAMIHGAASPRLFEPVAEVIATEMLGRAPDFLKDPSYAWSIRGWAEAEAKLLLFEAWMNTLPGTGAYTARGAQAPPIQTWRALSAHAGLLRARLGLDPVSRVRIGKALTSAGVDLARLNELMDSDEDGEAV